MVRRPESIPAARRAMREALDSLAHRGEETPCKSKPVLYTELRVTPAEAKKMCEGCPVIALCGPLGYTESVYADDMVYGGYVWRRGVPVVSETAYRERRLRKEEKERRSLYT